MVADLLEPVPRARLDLRRIERAMDFAFASGGTFTELDDCLDHATVSPTSWDAAAFERALFLRELCAERMPIRIDGKTYAPSATHLLRLVAHPPSDAETVRFRHEILRELAAAPTWRRELEQTYLRLRSWKELFGPKERSELPAPERKRMEILAGARAIASGLREGFAGAKSGLSRLSELGRTIEETPAFARLVSLLDLEQNLATIDTRLRIGRDGALRSVEIVAVRENVGNASYVSPLTRFLRRIVAFFRGYVLREEEVRDALVDGVFTGVRPLLAPLFQLQGDLELYLAALGFRDHVRAAGLDVCIPEIVATPEPGKAEARVLEGLFNPHLLGEEHPPTPCTLTFERSDAIVIFTGPNSGGKTRVLQAIALAQLMGQAGLFVAATRARLVAANGMFVSLIEEARADQHEGRLGTELLRIREVFERLRPGGAVLLDELCSGTNPSEGQEIFALVTELLAELSPQAFITTHFLDFAARLEAEAKDDRLAFLQVGLDAKSEPTFQFVRGVARSSLASKTAERLGVTREALLALVVQARAK